LDSGNKYAGTIIYTPPTDYVGTITISDGADFSGQVVIQPYAMTIALLGDSISNNMGTTYVKTALGNEFSILNVAVCGGTSSEYANDYIGTAKCGGFASQGEQVMTKALNAFSSNGVELVHIMIGTNDLGKETEQYKTNMQMIIDTLRDNPITQSQIKHVIISKLIWRDTSKVGGDLVKMAAFNEVIDELIAENGGFVLIGDEDAYAWFEVDNDTNMSDGLHPN
jgi:lysophospholipase L1-like esterase